MPEERELKVIEISKCMDCPHLKWYGYHGDCREDWDKVFTINDNTVIHESCKLSRPTEPIGKDEEWVEEFRKKTKEWGDSGFHKFENETGFLVVDWGKVIDWLLKTLNARKEG